jgi:hypothetical protein
VATTATLIRDDNRVVRPRDHAGRFANPTKEFRRLQTSGVLDRLAHGYYVVVPEELRNGYWRPAIEDVGLGIAVVDYGRDAVALMGPAAARVLGAIPRALATAVVAIPRERPALVTTAGWVDFVTRAVERLDVQRTDTEITPGWVTTPEQTALDLADRPLLGGATPTTITEAIRTLGPRCDLELVARLAKQQRKRAAWRRFAWVLGLPSPFTGERAPTYGLEGRGDPADYGLDAT